MYDYGGDEVKEGRMRSSKTLIRRHEIEKA